MFFFFFAKDWICCYGSCVILKTCRVRCTERRYKHDKHSDVFDENDYTVGHSKIHVRTETDERLLKSDPYEVNKIHVKYLRTHESTIA